MAEREMQVDVDIPIDIEGAYDPDGLPKVVATTRVKTPAAPAIKPEEVEALRRERDAERDARTRAQQDAAKATAAAKTATGKLTETQVQAYGAHYARINGELARINDAIGSTQAMADGAERELIAAERDLGLATEPADREALAERKVKASRELAKLESEMTALQTGKHQAAAQAEDAKRYWEAAAQHADAAAKAAAAEPPPKETEVQKTPQQLADEWIASCPSATRPWLRDNTEYTSDPKKHRQLLRFADEYADDHGGLTALDSQDFVAALNAKFKPREEVVEENDEPPAQTEAVSRGARTAAPVSRSSGPPSGNGAGGGNSRSRITLSGAEQSTALAMYPDMERPAALKKYAENKARAIADGLYAPRQ